MGYNQRNKTNTYYESFQNNLIKTAKLAKPAVQIKKSDGDNDIPNNEVEPLNYKTLCLHLRQLIGKLTRCCQS